MRCAETGSSGLLGMIGADQEQTALRPEISSSYRSADRTDERTHDVYFRVFLIIGRFLKKREKALSTKKVHGQFGHDDCEDLAKK